MYDLTTVLTTIAACSASIVAILGGFIASKLIALNAERNETNARITELDEEIDFFTEEHDMLQALLNEDDAFDFIKENIAYIASRQPLDAAYKEEERPRLEKEVLQPYWSRAEEIHSQYRAIIKKNINNYEENEDGVPVAVAKVFTQDFEYAVCKAISEHIEDQSDRFAALRRGLNATVSTGKWYADTQEKAMSVDNKITYLTLLRKQQHARLKALEKPKGMKLGLALFAFFSAANIVYPLCLSPYITENYQCYLKTKIFAISMLAVGLILIMMYLIYLLHWNNRKK